MQDEHITNILIEIQRVRAAFFSEKIVFLKTLSISVQIALSEEVLLSLISPDF
jgi:hypothetical protein